jgi:hypothetical protein
MGWQPAVDLQAELLEVCGWPDCREAYEKNLREAREWLRYLRQPKPDPSGLGGLAYQKRALKDAEAAVKWRQELLDNLPKLH